MKTKEKTLKKKKSRLYRKGILLSLLVLVTPTLPTAASDLGEGDENHYLVYRAVAEFRAPGVATDPNVLDQPSGAEYSIWCNPCSNTKVWIGLADGGAERLYNPDIFPTSSGFKMLKFKNNVEVYIEPCTDDEGAEMEECWIVSGSALLLEVYYVIPEKSCDPPALCPIGATI